MFKKNKKNSESELNSKKYFLISNIIYNKLNDRPLSFYKKYYKVNLNYSLIYIILTFLISSFATYNIHFKNKNHSIYLTNINGQTKEYERTEDRIKTIKETIRYLNSNKGK